MGLALEEQAVAIAGGHSVGHTWYLEQVCPWSWGLCWFLHQRDQPHTPSLVRGVMYGNSNNDPASRLHTEGKPGSPPTDRHSRDRSGSGDRESGKASGLLRGGGVHERGVLKIV